MPSAVKFIFSGDSTAYQRELDRMVQGAREAERKVVSGGGGAGAGMSGFGAGGFVGRMRVAGSMFASVARDSAASLASGAPISQVIMQQAPQVAQAFTFMGISLKLLGVAGIGAAAALLTLKKATEAYEAREQQRLSESNLKFIEGAGRAQLLQMLQADKSRLNPGESNSLAARLTGAIGAYYRGGETAELKAKMDEQEKFVRSRLREVHITDAEKKNLKQLSELQFKYHLETLEGKNKERVAEMAQYNDRKRELTELSKAAKTPADNQLAQLAFRAAYDAHEKKMKEIDASDIKQFSPSVTDRERIGLGSASSVNVSLLDINKKSEGHLREISKAIKSGGISKLDSIF